jgi:hypothetical protein
MASIVYIHTLWLTGRQCITKESMGASYVPPTKGMET